jgi:serine/threonine protein kinase
MEQEEQQQHQQHQQQQQQSLSMYEKLGRIGEGTYGVVYRARDKKTNEIVALKKVRMDREKDGVPITTLREVRILQHCCSHENIVHLMRVVQGNQLNNVFLVFEYCEHDLASLLDNMRQPFLESESKCLIVQLLKAVEYLHDRWIMHRDLKLSNLLLNNRGELKLCDFGLARSFEPEREGEEESDDEIEEEDDEEDDNGKKRRRRRKRQICYTPKVVTLWYRAPEVLFGDDAYTASIDIWAAGCVLAEFLKHDPLFPGKTEVTQLELIFKLLGAPNERIWPGWSKLPNVGTTLVPEQPYNYLEHEFPNLHQRGIDLLNLMLTYDPKRRCSAKDALAHPYFKTQPRPKLKSEMPSFPTLHSRVNKNENDFGEKF